MNDLPYYLLSGHLPSTTLLNALLAVPEAMRGFLLTLKLVDAATVTARLVAPVAVLFGATGAATLPVLATAMSDMVSCTPILAALLTLFPHEQGPMAMAARSLLLTGLLVGLALGLKLTLSYAAGSMVSGLLCWPGQPAQARLRSAALSRPVSRSAWPAVPAGGGGSMHSPAIRRSRSITTSSSRPWPLGNVVDIRFLSHGLRAAPLYPFLRAIRSIPLMTEPDQPMRDPRMAPALLHRQRCRWSTCADAIWCRAAPDSWRCCAWWVSCHGSAVLDPALSVAARAARRAKLAALAPVVLRGPVGQQACLNGAMALLFLVGSWTVPPRWGRLPQAGGRPISVAIPQLPGHALVLLLDAACLSCRLPAGAGAVLRRQQQSDAALDENGPAGAHPRRHRDAASRPSR